MVILRKMEGELFEGGLLGFGSRDSRTSLPKIRKIRGWDQQEDLRDSLSSNRKIFDLAVYGPHEIPATARDTVEMPDLPFSFWLDLYSIVFPPRLAAKLKRERYRIN